MKDMREQAANLDRVRRQIGEVIWQAGTRCPWSKALQMYPEEYVKATTCLDSYAIGRIPSSEFVDVVNAALNRIDAIVSVLRKYPDDALNLITETP